MEDANNLIADLREHRVAASKLFPGGEHLKPLSSLLKFWRTKVNEFYSRELSKLVHMHKIEGLMERAPKIDIDPHCYQVKMLAETLHNCRELRKELRKHSTPGSLTYADAKVFFTELLSQGVYMPEAIPVRDLIWVNSSLERRLAETLDRESLLKIQQMITHEKKNVDPELVSSIIELINEFERLEGRVNSLLSRTHIDFKDIEVLEELDRALKNSRLVLPADRQFRDLFASFSWTIRVSLDLGIKANSLDHVVMQLKPLLDHKLSENYMELLQILAPIASVSFSISPVKDCLVFCKVLLWRCRVKVAFADQDIDLTGIEELVGSAPANIERYPEAFNEFRLVNGVVEKAKDWRKKCSDYFIQVESLFGMTNPQALTAKIKSLSTTLVYLQNQYQKEDLKLIKNLSRLWDQLSQTEQLLLACTHIARMLNGELIEFEQFLTITEIVESSVKDDRKYSLLMHQFQKLQRDILPSLEQLNKVLNAIQCRNEDYRRLDTKTLLARQKDKIKVFDIEYHLQKLTSLLNMGDFGEQIKFHLQEFLEWEKDAKLVMSQNKIKGMVSVSTKEQIILLINKIKEYKKNFIRSNLYSNLLDELITYYWCLRAVALLNHKSGDLDEFKKLIDQQINHTKLSKSLHSMLRSQVTAANYLMQFCDKCENHKPSSREVKKIKMLLHGFKVNLGHKLKVPKQYTEHYIRIKKKVKEFKALSKPTIEKVEDIVEDLKKEEVRFRKEILEFQELASEMKSLIKQAKKKNKVFEAVKRYLELNVSSTEFESLVKEKPLDATLEAELEMAVEQTNNYEGLLNLEAKAEQIDDVDWTTSLREKIFLKKVKILEDAIDEKADLLLNTAGLKSLYANGKHMSSKLEEVQRKLGVVDDLIKRVDKKLRVMRELPSERISRLRRRLFKCIDISKEMEEFIAKNKLIEGAATGAEPKSTMANATVALTTTHTAHGGESSRPRPSSSTTLLKKRRPEPMPTAVEQHVKKKEGATKPARTGRKEEKTEKREKREEKRVIEFAGEGREKENVLDSTWMKPRNPGGIWGVFEGNAREESSGRTVESIQLLTFDSWSKINSFPQLPLTLSFREKISPSELNRRIENSGATLSSDCAYKILGGIVRCEGLSRNYCREVFDSPDSLFLSEYSRSSSLVFIPVRSFERKWYSLFEKNDRVKSADCDFYFLILCGEESPGMRINPFRVDKIENKENSSFALETFRELEEKPRPGGLSSLSRLTTRISEILGANSSALNRAEQPSTLESN